MSVGFDFGDRFSSVSVMKNGIPEVVADFQGLRRIANVITYTDTDELLGEEAITRAMRFPNSSISHLYHFIGKKFSELKDISKYPFQVVGEDDNIFFRIIQGEKVIMLSPVEAVSKIFKYLKTITEAFMGSTINNCIINIVSDLNSLGRENLIKAAKMAGINNCQLIKNPVAVCLAYEFDLNTSLVDKTLDPVPEKKIIIIDFGESLKVSIVSINNGFIYIVKDEIAPNFGAYDIDNLLFELFSGEYKKKTGIDVKTIKRSKLKLLTECEKVKQNLSRIQQVKVSIDGLAEGMDFNTSISRARYEDLIDGIFKKTINFINTVIGDIPRKSFEDVILIGGTSQIPRFNQVITTYFEKEPKTLNAENSVALGTAIASKCFERGSEPVKVKKTAFSIGLKSQDGKMIVMIPKNTPIPAKSTKTFANTHTDSSFLDLSIFEGDSELTEQNRQLGQFVIPLDDFEKSEIGSEHIRSTFILDNSGTLTIKVIGTLSTNEKTFKIALENK